MTDLISRLAGIEPGSPVDAAFAERSGAREGAEAAYRRLLEPDDPGPVSLVERRAVAAFVAALNHLPAAVKHYRALIESTDRAIATAVLLSATEARAQDIPGPWGGFPPGPLAGEAEQGLPFRLADAHRRTLGDRLAAAIEHVHLLVMHPRDASPAALRALTAAGWTADGIVTLTQLVGFIGFQIRTVTGLAAVAAARASRTAFSATATDRSVP